MTTCWSFFCNGKLLAEFNLTLKNATPKHKSSLTNEIIAVSVEQLNKYDTNSFQVYEEEHAGYLKVWVKKSNYLKLRLF